MKIRDTEFQPVEASAFLYPAQLPTQNPTRTFPLRMLLQCPSIWRVRRGLSCRFLPDLPKYTIPSIARGAEHSAPLKVKNQRLQQYSHEEILKAPVQAARRAVSLKFLVNTQSCIKIKQGRDKGLKII